MLRNFMTTIRKYMAASVLNILGLSVSLAAFYIIISQVTFELNFDKWHKDSDRIYKVELASDGKGQTVVSRAFIQSFARSSPLIENSMMVVLPWRKSYLIVEHDGNKVGFLEELEGVDSSIADLFEFKMLEGSAKALEDPNKIIVPKSKAKVMFGGGSSLGKTINKDGKLYEVGGVYKDFTENTQLNNRIFYKVSDREGVSDDGSYSWGTNNYFFYVKLAKGADSDAVIKEYEANFDLEQVSGYKMKPILTLMSDLYYAKRDFVVEDLIKHGDSSATAVMFAIAILILVIAAINFVNFATSLAPMRMKAINIKKVLGSTDSKLRLSLVSEALLLCVVSLLISFVIVQLLSESKFQDITMSKITLVGNWNIIGITIAIALILGVASGIYPAIYTTNFSPALALKGGVFSSKKGQLLRNMLMSVQFVISTVLVISAIFLQLQSYYIKNISTGLPKENIVVAELGGELLGNYRLENELKLNPFIVDVAYSQFNIGGSNLSQGWGRGHKDKKIMFSAHLVSWNFPKMMGLTMLEGDMFSEDDIKKEQETLIFNQTAATSYDISIGDAVGGYPVKGIVKDFNFKSLHHEITPMALVYDSRKPIGLLGVIYIRIKGNAHEALDHIRKVAKEIDPAYQLSLNFYNQTFDNLYKKEQKSIMQITLFSILTIIISLVGVFGLVIFESQYRRKEIGLRRINGATLSSILVMLNRKFVILVLVCFVIASPIAIYGVSEWLSEFAYRTPLKVWVFLVALLVVMLVTVITVTFQSWRAATENPIKSIKSE